MSDDATGGCIVGLVSAQIPREILHALGCTAVRIFPTATKATAAEAYLPRNFCSLAKLILASFLEPGGPQLDAVIFVDEDDATRRLHDVWSACVQVPVWGFLEVPRSCSPQAVARFTDLLAALTRDLEVHTGQAMTLGRLRAAIALHNEQRNLLAGLKRRWLDGRLNTVTYRRLRRAALTEDVARANADVRREIEGTEAPLMVPSANAAKGPVLRLLLLAELAAPPSLVRLVESHDARVVAEDADLDELDVSDAVADDAGTIEGLLAALATAYLSKPPAPRMRDVSRRLRYLTRLVDERGAEAAICAYNKFCDLRLVEYPALKAQLEGREVPVLLLELEDDTLSGQHRTRVEAFLEMVQRRD